MWALLWHATHVPLHLDSTTVGAAAAAMELVPHAQATEILPGITVSAALALWLGLHLLALLATCVEPTSMAATDTPPEVARHVQASAPPVTSVLAALGPVQELPRVVRLVLLELT